MKLRLRVLLPALLMAASCAPAGDPSSTPSTSAPRGRNAPITQQMIADAQDGNLYRVVRRLQPTWLQLPASTTGSEIGVFLDDRYMGGPDALSSIPTTQVAQVRYLNARQVRQELADFQSVDLAAAIMITSLRVRP
jgi:hypothetical protein